ncbi:type II toxin-antitoxin system HipA family toxin YjjJ [Myxococcus sp. K15C18031901]|uniref:type II toxin-antitoxin system HipA family toxin YjjJ n=1 Tax=Myxococcus dinghuensis TaxID=2906761 RepID=UPI0020A778CA|nr:type II toxin-antitoxin system HipA family toxin YjjJ [Myxococcus dinghuensis]MCP3099847.1 type II toxin-antitoxin system HipA family toxin YjjJ [Myxococcus dinghuensis]
MATVEQLLAVLDQFPDASAEALAERLQTDRSTVKRLLTSAGERVCAMRQDAGTRYARTRELPGLGAQLPVHRVDDTGRVHRHGTLHLLADGGHWLERTEGASERFAEFLPVAMDMSPQGYLGERFTTLHPDLHLPTRVTTWTDDEYLIALGRRGEDCVGALILGDESLRRFLATPLQEVGVDAFPALAVASRTHPSSALVGGEHPKFTAYVEGRHVIVKFAPDDAGEVSSRWRDLLVTEHLALATLRDAGRDAARSRWMDVQGYRFLEVERFDRVGPRGRRELLSLDALTSEDLDARSIWTQSAQRLLEAGSISREDATRMRWLDTFGQLIGNTDRHFGNLSFFPEGTRRFRLAPVYDMLPMVFAPVGTVVPEREFEPLPPTADTLDVWHDAARHALTYWARLAREPALSPTLRERCARCGDTLQALVREVPA